MTWNPVSTQVEAGKLLDLFDGFHDSIIREAHLCTEDFVTLDQCMHCSSGLGSRVRLLFQRQSQTLSAIEMLFEGVDIFHFKPTPVGRAPDIIEATLLCEVESVYWADVWAWTPTSPQRDESTWLAAKKLSWRDASDWMGADLRYGSDAPH